MTKFPPITFLPGHEGDVRQIPEAVTHSCVIRRVRFLVYMYEEDCIWRVERTNQSD
jgi:hypothetical protein